MCQSDQLATSEGAHLANLNHSHHHDHQPAELLWRAFSLRAASYTTPWGTTEIGSLPVRRPAEYVRKWRTEMVGDT